MASFHAKIGWKRQRKGENKIVVPFCSHPTQNRKFQKNSKKIDWGRQRKGENKNYRFVSFLPYA